MSSAAARSKQSDQVRPAPEIATVADGAAFVLADLEKGSYFTLNETGSRIWELAVGGSAIGSVAQTLSAEYDLGTVEAEQYVRALVDQLISLGLLVWQ